MRALSGPNPGPMNTSAPGTAEGHWGRPEGLFEGLSMLPSATVAVLSPWECEQEIRRWSQKNRSQFSITSEAIIKSLMYRRSKELRRKMQGSCGKDPNSSSEE